MDRFSPGIENAEESPPRSFSRSSRHKDRLEDRERSRRNRSRRYSPDHRDYRDYEDEGWDRSSRSREDRYDTDRRRHRSRDRSRDRDWDRDYDHDHDYDPRSDDLQGAIPTETIMVRGFGPDVTEEDIRNEVLRCNLEPKEIRLMRRKNSGVSRRFAFVEFGLLSEAVRWKELTQGMIILGGMRASLHYSLRDHPRADKPIRTDWNCNKCGVTNFRRRTVCFKCSAPREVSELFNSRVMTDGLEEVSTTPNYTLLLRNLDVLTTEETVLSALGQLTSLPIKCLRIPKDPVTNISRGYCYVELHSTIEATQLHDLLLAMGQNFVIDSRQVSVSYARRSLSYHKSLANNNAASLALAAAQWTNQPVNHCAQPALYGSHDAGSKTDSSSKTLINLGTVIVNGVSYPKYPVPDVSTFQYDQTSGFYYDPQTGFYYDANSQYFYVQETQQYVYWDGEKQTYLPAPSGSSDGASEASSATETSMSSTTTAATATTAPPSTSTAATITASATLNDDKSKPKDKQEKVKIAKKIAKDMEKWAKTLNQKKENAKLNITTPSGPHLASTPDTSSKPATSADAGFSVLEKKSNLISDLVIKKSDPQAKSLAIVAAYGDTDSENEEDDKAIDAWNDALAKLVDWTKMVCLLCKRQFQSKESLSKHQQLSNLHKQNLNTLRRKMLSDSQIEELNRREKDANYRDRAKERREKFGLPDHPLTDQEDPSADPALSPGEPEDPTSPGISTDNIGNRMLKAMGWSEGQGLGKDNKGTSNIIEVSSRIQSAGLGMKGATVSSNSSVPFNYRENGKKIMKARLEEMMTGRT